MTVRDMINALAVYDLDTPVWIDRVGPVGEIQPWTSAAGDTTLLVRAVTP